MDKRVNHLLTILTVILLLLPSMASILNFAQAQEEGIPEGGTLRISLPSDIGTKNVFLRASTWEYDFCAPIYDSLWRMWPDSSGDYVPWMTYPNYTVSEDGLVWTFTLLENITWHDGVPLTADDVVFTIEHVKKYEYPRWSDVWTNIDHAEKVSKYTFRIYLSNPYAPFLRRIISDILVIVPKHIWEKIEQKPDFDPLTYEPTIDEMVGCGPFKLVEYVPTSHVKYVANKNYYRRGYKGPWGVVGPWVDELIFPIITSNDAAVMAVLSGDIDGMRASGGVGSAAVPILLKDPNIDIQLVQQTSFCHWGFNTWMWPFSEKKFRKALAHAIDLDEIVKVAKGGYAVPGSPGVLPPHYYKPYYNPNVTRYEFNLTKAAELLDEIGIVDRDGDGWRDLINPETGELLVSGSGPNTLEIYPPDYSTDRIRAAEMIRDWLAQLPGGGIKFKVVIESWDTMFKRVKQTMDPSVKPMTWLVCSGLSPDPDRLRDRLHSSKIPNPNYYGFNNSRFDELAELQRTIMNETERAKLIWEMQEILADELPCITLYYRTAVYPHRTDKFIGWCAGPLSSGLGEWSQMCVHLKPVALKRMTLTLLKYPATTVVKGTAFELQVKLADENGNPINDATVTALITGIATPLTLSHMGNGIYGTTINTTDFMARPYTVGIQAQKTGFESESATISFEVTEGEKEEEVSTGGAPPIALYAAIIIIIVVVVVAYALRRKRE